MNEVTPLPKPARVVDLEVLRAYHDSHPICEMPGCLERATKVPHHLKTRAAGGDDVPENLISLCVVHHSLVHSSAKFRKYAWEVKYGKAD